jgi:hypothetical protein
MTILHAAAAGDYFARAMRLFGDCGCGVFG